MYSSPDELKLLLSEKELVQLAGEGRSRAFDDEAVQAVLVEAIDQADGEIDSYIGMAVALPLASTPKLVGNISSKIAVYNLMRRRPSVPDHWQSEYERCLKILEKIAGGKLSLGVLGGGGGGSGVSTDDDKGAGIVSGAGSWGGFPK